MPEDDGNGDDRQPDRDGAPGIGGPPGSQLRDVERVLVDHRPHRLPFAVHEAR